LQDDISGQQGKSALDHGILSERDAYVRKKVDAWGKFVARMLGIEVGLSTNPFNEAAIPDERVTTKNEC
jgi:hypothetical protein